MINNISELKEWQIKKLPEIVFFQEGPGVRNNQYTEAGVKLLNVANLIDGKVVLENTNRYISEEEAYGKYKHFLVDEGDLIIASSGIKVEYFDKKMGFAKKEHLPLCMNTSTIRFKSLDNNNLNLKYFSYFLKSIYFKKQIARLITGSAQLNFGPSHLKQIEVIVPPINIQNNIVDILEKSKYIIDKRKEQIKDLDELVKSQFIEMFGYLKVNSKQWNVLAFEEFAIIDTNMTKDFEKYAEYPHIGIDSIEKNTGNILEYQLVKDCSLKSGKYLFDERHIIYSKIRPNLNKVGLPKFKGVCSADAYPILCIDKIADRNYLGYVLRSEFFLNYILAFSGRTNIPKVNKEQLKGFNMPTPPIELQKQFADFVKQTDKLKFEMEKNLKELEDNFNSLMQKAFNRELFN